MKQYACFSDIYRLAANSCSNVTVLSRFMTDSLGGIVMLELLVGKEVEPVSQLPQPVSPMRKQT